jgi:hypothetical protein
MEHTPFCSDAYSTDDTNHATLSIGVNMLPFFHTQPFIEWPNADKGHATVSFSNPITSPHPKESPCIQNTRHWITARSIAEHGILTYLNVGRIGNWGCSWGSVPPTTLNVNYANFDESDTIPFEIKCGTRIIATEVNAAVFLNGVDGLFWNKMVVQKKDGARCISLDVDECDTDTMGELMQFSLNSLIGTPNNLGVQCMQEAIYLFTLACQLGHTRLLKHLLVGTLPLGNMQMISLATIVSIYADSFTPDDGILLLARSVLHEFDTHTFLLAYCSNPVTVSLTSIPLSTIALLISSNTSSYGSILSLYLLEVWVHGNSALLGHKDYSHAEDFINILKNIEIPGDMIANFWINAPSNTAILCKNYWGGWGFLITQYIYSRASYAMEGITMFPTNAAYKIQEIHRYRNSASHSTPLIMVGNVSQVILQASTSTETIPLMGCKAGVSVRMNIQPGAVLMQVRHPDPKSKP